MIKSVNIDGTDYIIRECCSCPFYDNGDDGYGAECQYPVNPSKLEEMSSWGMCSGQIAKDCPLGLVKDCCTCKHEERRKEDKWCDPCCKCTVTYHGDTRVTDPPSRWKVKE